MQLTKNFNSVEFDCRDGTPVPEELMDNVQRLAENLQVLRDYLGEPVRVLSGYRTVSHNKAVGGASKSQHLIGKAADITVKSKTPKSLATIIRKLKSEGKMKAGGLGTYPGFIHTDIRGKNVEW